MKILHTSDWHLGISFEGISRDRDHEFFLKWLVQILAENKIDVLIIAGDIFDQQQPSAEAQKIYYKFLFQVSKYTLVKKVILLGGNHDSPSRLEAPAELLNLLDVFVVGGFSADTKMLDRYLCKVYDEKNRVKLVVVVVPYIHEYRLGVRTALNSENEIQKCFKEKITELYRELADEAEKFSEGAPIIATGHLACVGFEKDDALLDIHMVGTLGGFSKEIFDTRYSYIALGHIHRAYRVENSNAYYCGSPIPLSIKESKTPRYVQIVSFQDNNIVPEVQKLEVPLYRKILELIGTLEEIIIQIENLNWHTPAPPVLCIQVFVDYYMAGINLEISKKINYYHQKNPPILAVIRQIVREEAEKYPNEQTFISLKDLTAEQVFIKICQNQNEEIDNDLLIAFRSLLNEENL